MSMKIHFENNEDVEFDEEFDNKLIDYLRQLQSKGNDGYRSSQKRIEEFSDAFIAVCSIVPDSYEVTIKKGALSQDGWFVVIKATSIQIDKPKKLVDAVLSIADNFEVTAEPDGSVVFSIGFYGMVERG